MISITSACRHKEEATSTEEIKVEKKTIPEAPHQRDHHPAPGLDPTPLPTSLHAESDDHETSDPSSHRTPPDPDAQETKDPSQTNPLPCKPSQTTSPPIGPQAGFPPPGTPLIPDPSKHLDPTQVTYTHQELVDYINSSFYFHKHTIPAGTLLFRCEDDASAATIPIYPWFLAQDVNFHPFQELHTGLCIFRSVYSYTVLKDIELVDFRANPRRQETPNGHEILHVNAIQAFHHLTQQNAPYPGHIVDYTLEQFILENPLQAAIHPRWAMLGIKRIQYFCEEVLQNPTYRAYNEQQNILGWVDYDLGFLPPTHAVVGGLTREDHRDIQEVMLCNPSGYIAFNKLERQGI